LYDAGCGEFIIYLPVKPIALDGGAPGTIRIGLSGNFIIIELQLTGEFILFVLN